MEMPDEFATIWEGFVDFQSKCRTNVYRRLHMCAGMA